MLFIISSITDHMLSITAFIIVFINSDIIIFNAVIWSDENRLKLVMFVNEWNIWLFRNDMFNFDFIFDIFIMKNEKTAETCSFSRIRKSKKKDFWNDFNFNWNNKLLKLCCNFTFNFDSIDFRNFLIIWIRSFFKNCVWKTRKFKLFDE